MNVLDFGYSIKEESADGVSAHPKKKGGGGGGGGDR